MLVVYKFGFIFAGKPTVDYKGNKKGLINPYIFCEIYVKCNFYEGAPHCRKDPLSDLFPHSSSISRSCIIRSMALFLHDGAFHRDRNHDIR